MPTTGDSPLTDRARVRAVAAGGLATPRDVNRLRDAGASETDLELCAEKASERPELEMTPPPADLDELRELYRAAY